MKVYHWSTRDMKQNKHLLSPIPNSISQRKKKKKKKLESNLIIKISIILLKATKLQKSLPNSHEK